MNEPTIWLQLGITQERYPVIEKEIKSILMTKETIGNMMLMIQQSTKMNSNEQLYAAFMVSKEDIVRRLMNAMPAIGKPLVKIIMEE